MRRLGVRALRLSGAQGFRASRPRLEWLEDRSLLSTFTVVNTNDDGNPGSLRWAIGQVNSDPAATSASPDTIAFNIPGGGLHTISPLSDLPVVTSPVIIDGFTQPGSSPNTNPTTQAINAVPLIEINGTQDLYPGVGLTISAGNSTVRGLVIGGFSGGFTTGGSTGAINLQTLGGDTIAGDFINTDAAGTTQLPGLYGILLGPGTSNTTIGGTAPADRNLITASGVMIYNPSPTGVLSNLKIQGNFVGTDITGARTLATAGQGVTLLAINLRTPGTGLVIGGTSVGRVTSSSGTRSTSTARAVPSSRAMTSGSPTTAPPRCSRRRSSSESGRATSSEGRPPAGNVLNGGLNLTNSTGNVIQGNFIGTDPTGTVNFGNGAGISLTQSDGNLVGGPAPGAANVIAFTGGVVVSGVKNTITRNSIYANQREGINNTGVLPNAPLLLTASPTSFVGTLQGAPDTAYLLDFYASPQIPSGQVGSQYQTFQGKTFLFEPTVTTDHSGLASFTLSPPAPAPSGQILTATATDPTGTTSSTSKGLVVTGQVATSADLSVALAPSPDPVRAGDNLTYKITVNNAGPDPAQAVTLTDTVPSNARFVSLDAPAGWTAMTPAVGGSGTVSVTDPSLVGSAPAVFTLVVRVDPAAASGATVNDTATVASSTPDPNPDDNSVTRSTGVSAATAASADLAVSFPRHPEPGRAGGPADVRHHHQRPRPRCRRQRGRGGPGPRPHHVRLLQRPGRGERDRAAGGRHRPGDRQDGGGGDGPARAFTLVVRVDKGTPGGTVISDTASVSGDTADPVPGNNSATASNTVATAGGVGDLAVVTAVAPDPAPFGRDLTYRIVVTNKGTAPAAGAYVLNALPAGVGEISLTIDGAPAGARSWPAMSCAHDLGTVAPGVSRTIVILANPSARAWPSTRPWSISRGPIHPLGRHGPRRQPGARPADRRRPARRRRPAVRLPPDADLPGRRLQRATRPGFGRECLELPDHRRPGPGHPRRLGRLRPGRRGRDAVPVDVPRPA